MFKCVIYWSVCIANETLRDKRTAPNHRTNPLWMGERENWHGKRSGENESKYRKAEERSREGESSLMMWLLSTCSAEAKFRFPWILISCAFCCESGPNHLHRNRFDAPACAPSTFSGWCEEKNYANTNPPSEAEKFDCVIFGFALLHTESCLRRRWSHWLWANYSKN